MPHSSQRRKAASVYDELLAKVDGVATPKARPGEQAVYHQYVVRLENGDRDEVLKSLQAAGIMAGIHYPVPLHRQPAFAHLPVPLSPSN